MKRRDHLLILAALLGLAVVVQVLGIRRATVPGLDAVRFAAMAQSIGERGLWATVRCVQQQPLFPACVWLVHAARQGTGGGGQPDWATSVQLAAAAALVLAVVPLYLALGRLVGVAGATAGTLLFCLLPEVARLGADGISDSTHLLFFCVAFWSMVEYLGGRPLWLLPAGLATALALMARAEVLVLVVALAVAVVAFQFTPRLRRPWPNLAAAAGWFLMGLGVVLGPYLAASAAVTPSTAVARLLGRHAAEEPPAQPPTPAAGHAGTWHLPDGTPLSFDRKEPSVSIRRRGLRTAVVCFGRKLADALGYWIGALAVFGMYWLSRERMTRADRFVQIFFAIFSAVAIAFAATEGYLAPRHLMPLVVAAIGCAGLGALGWGRLVGRWLRLDGHGVLGAAAAWTAVVVAGSACLPQTLIRVHDSRLGHRQAAEWLASAAGAPGAVLDTRGWTGLYSGRQTYLFTQAPRALGNPRLAYVVVERNELGFASRRSRTLRHLLATAGRPVAEFPARSGRKPNQQPVRVYRWHPGRFPPPEEDRLARRPAAVVRPSSTARRDGRHHHRG